MAAKKKSKAQTNGRARNTAQNSRCLDVCGISYADESRIKGKDDAVVDVMYPQYLPFRVHRSTEQLPQTAGATPDAERWRWTDEVCQVTEALLDNGLAISLWVRPDHLAQATLIISQRLCRNVYGRYESEGHRLILSDGERVINRCLPLEDDDEHCRSVSKDSVQT